jgi:hypothetical protein
MAALAGALGLFVLGAIVYAVITVSNESTHQPVRGAPTPLKPVPSVTTSLSPTEAATQPPTELAPPPPVATPEPAPPTATPPTVTETASTLNTSPEFGAPEPGGHFRWRDLFPHLHLDGE